jgi:hypothetical protein
MSIQPRSGLIFLCGFLLVASPCQAVVTLQPVQGEVFINHGQGYQLVTGPIQANTGDAIMVNPNGTATVGYPDGCTVNVRPGEVTTITPSSPCSSPYAGQEPPPPQQPVAGPPSDSNALLWGIAGVLAAAGLGVGIYEAISP